MYVFQPETVLTMIVFDFFPHPQSSPDKDIDVFTAKVTLRNSQKLMLQTTWNWDFLHDVIEGTKDRIPAMANAGLTFVNKYHTSHFGFDLNRGGMKLKNTIFSVIDRIYNELLMSFNTLQNSVKYLGDKVKEVYSKGSDSLISMGFLDVKDTLAHNAKQVLKLSKDKMHVLLDMVTQFLSDTKFNMPGSDQKLSSLEMFQLTGWSVSKAIDRAIQRFASLMEKISDYIRGIELTIPGSEVVINGDEIMDKLHSLYDDLTHSLHRGFKLLHKAVNDFFQVISENVENFITFLKDKNVKFASQVDVIYAEVLQSSKQHTEEAKRHMAKYRDLSKQMIREACSGLSLEHVTNNVKETVSIFQSHLYQGLNETVALMRKTSQATAPYIRVSNKKMDIEVPLPFYWKSFSEWPAQSRQ